MLATRSRRRSEILAAARRLVEAGGPAALTMRALGDAVGMRAPSLYKHFPDKDAVEAALGESAMRELGEALDVGLAAYAEPPAAFAAAYRAWARAHPHLYRLVAACTAEPGPPTRVDRSTSIAQRLLSVAGDAALARALWGLCHGLALLETGGRFPHAAAADAAWASGVAAVSRAAEGARSPGGVTDAAHEPEQPQHDAGAAEPSTGAGRLGHLAELRRQVSEDPSREPDGED